VAVATRRTAPGRCGGSRERRFSKARWPGRWRRDGIKGEPLKRGRQEFAGGPGAARQAVEHVLGLARERAPRKEADAVAARTRLG